jgi:hypothetical protein
MLNGNGFYAYLFPASGLALTSCVDMLAHEIIQSYETQLNAYALSSKAVAACSGVLSVVEQKSKVIGIRRVC